LPHGLYAYWDNYAPTPERSLIPEIARQIPPDARLCVQNNLGPHFANRRDTTCKYNRCLGADVHLYHLRYLGGSRSGLFMRTSTRMIGGIKSLRRRFEPLFLSPDWGLTYQKEGFYLFKKGAASIMDRKQARKRYNKDLALFRQQLRQARLSETPLRQILVLSTGELTRIQP
jgi:hypothetical protein